MRNRKRLVSILAGILAGMCTGLLHVKLGIPIILAGILTQFSLYSINLRIMGMAANKAGVVIFTRLSVH